MAKKADLDPKSQKQRDSLLKDIDTLEKGCTALTKEVDTAIKDANRMMKEG